MELSTLCECIVLLVLLLLLLDPFNSLFAQDNLGKPVPER